MNELDRTEMQATIGGAAEPVPYIAPTPDLSGLFQTLISQQRANFLRWLQSFAAY